MKICIILKEFKNPRAMLLRVWAKNQWGLKFVEKILKFTYKSLNGNFTFSIFYPIFQELCHVYSSVSVSGGASPAGAPVVFIIRRNRIGRFSVLTSKKHANDKSSNVKPPK